MIVNEDMKTRFQQASLAAMRESFARQTPEQRQHTLERIQALLEREGQREHTGAKSYLWRYASQIYGI